MGPRRLVVGNLTPSVVSHAEVYNMICVSYAARYVDEQRGISGNA
jgi:hypothetical protein